MFNSNWYETLNSPLLTPPNSVFAPVWIILYFLIFVSLMVYILSENKDKKYGYLFFIIQLFLNLMWVPVFFLKRNILGALFLIILLDIFVFLTLKKFYKISKWSGHLLIPYFLWILFATYLNFGYFFLN